MAKTNSGRVLHIAYGSLWETRQIVEQGEEDQTIMHHPTQVAVPGSSASSTIASTESESSILIPITPSEEGCHDYKQSASNKTVSNHSRLERNSAAADLRLSMLSNFSTAYNVLSISLALDILAHGHHQVTAADKSLCSSALFAGMIVGQLGGGALGDILGRHLAMTLVMLLQVLASLLSSFSTDIRLGFVAINIFHVLAFWRFVLGLGCGGVYPLAATLTAESSSSDSSVESSDNTKGRCVALAFSFQGVGYLVVPIVAYVVVSVLGESSDLAWRLLLGFGAVPGIALTASRVRNNVLHNTVPAPPAVNQLATQAQRTPSVVEAIRQEPQLTRKLLGTGGCWLLFDILFYGNTLFQPIVLACAFGKEQETVQKAARDSATIACLALPGYLMSVWMIGRQSPRYIQLQGFAAMALLYACIASSFERMSGNHYLLLGVYGSTFFVSNYGPNATTFMLPAMTFTKRCRSTLNGVCAACGKVGALVGSMVFAHVAQDLTTVFWSCAVLSSLGYVVTIFCVNPPPTRHHRQDEDVLTVVEQGGTHAMVGPAKVFGTRIPSVFSMPSIFDFHEDILEE